MLFLMVVKIANGQSVSTVMGARAMAMGNATAAQHDAWSLWNNPAALAHLRQMQTALALERRPALPGQGRMASVFTSPLAHGTLGAGAFKFGDDLYNEMLLSLGYGHTLGLASLGLSVSYLQMRAEGWGTSQALTLSAGGQAKLSEAITVGAVASNINQPRLANNERVPARLSAGVQYTPSATVVVLAEVEKHLDFNPSLRMGVEYTIHKKIIARTGYQLWPSVAGFGAGYKTYRLTIDYALQQHLALGATHQASLAYFLQRQKSP